MQFTSLAYLPFLALAWVVLRLGGERARWPVLLAASLSFYAALSVPYLPAILLVVAAATWAIGLRIGRSTDSGAKRRFLALGIVVNLAVLVVLKYLPMISGALGGIAGLLSIPAPLPAARVFVAIGVSYFVFQAISYLVDVYMETLQPETHLGYFTLYLAFFPKLLQGPIERGEDLLPQLRTRYEFDYENVRSGLLLFAWGMFKKVVIADRLGLWVDACYGNVEAYSGLALVLATWAYAFQIYMDFSGYTDMAIGSARLFNIKLTQNFRDPFLATSIPEFWRRWHISFSRWILDYIFRPLQLRWRNWTSRGTAAALFVTFVVCGLWHGASYGFFVFGVLHGIYMACAVFYAPWERKFLKRRGIEKGPVVRAAEVILTFNLVCLSWVFFRAGSLADAWYVVTHAIDGTTGGIVALLWSQGGLELALLGVLSMATLVVSYSVEKLRPLFLRSTPFRWAVYYTLVGSILVFGLLGESEFLYFKY